MGFVRQTLLLGRRGSGGDDKTTKTTIDKLKEVYDSCLSLPAL